MPASILSRSFPRPGPSACDATLVLVLASLWSGASPAVLCAQRTRSSPMPSRQEGPPTQRTIGPELPLAPDGSFGTSLAALGDFDGNAVPDLVVSAPGDDDGGALWLLFLDRWGAVIGQRKLSASSGGFTGDPVALGCTLHSVDRLGDLDGDGVADLLVGSPNYDGTGPGNAWVLFLEADGTVREHVRIGAGSGGFAGTPDEYFGASVTALGDLDGDGVLDAAVGGAFSAWILFLRPDGTVRDQRLLQPGSNGFPFPGYPLSTFGLALEGLGDFDGDGVGDVAAHGQEWLFEGEIGHVFLLLLRADGTVKASVDTSSVDLGFWPVDTCPVWYGDNSFGVSLANLGDVDGNGVLDLGVGAPWPGAGDCCEDEGGVWILALLPDGSVLRSHELTHGSPPWNLEVGPLDSFGVGLAALGDLDGDGQIELAIGAPDSRGIVHCPAPYVEEPLGSVRLLFRLP